MKSQLTFLAAAGIIFTFNSCTEDSFKVKPSPVNLTIDQSQNPGTELGRVLFYDSHLSVNNAISCGSCHKQTLAFSDNVSLSRGFENIQTSRNAPPIQNLGNSFFGSSELFWDGRESFLQSMVLKPIVNHVEMGMNDMDDVVERVRNLPYYADLFEKAFGTPEVTADGIAFALASFTGSIFSFSTRFDRYMGGQESALSAIELQGKNLFFEKYNCNSCHQTQESNGYQIGGGFVNIGLDVNYVDKGRGAFTHHAEDDGKFKIPNLRNIALTAPYMHDGRFATLDAVLEHYSHGIINHPNLDSRLKGTDGQGLQLNITNEEKTAIIAFLNALTDFQMITNPAYSNPFKVQ
jgi:cytochrome c peroxidase